MKSLLADRYAEIKMNIEKLEAELNVLKAEIKATGQDAIEGDYFRVTVSLGERKTLSKELLAAHVAPEVISACEKATMFEQIRYKAIV